MALEKDELPVIHGTDYAFELISVIMDLLLA